MFIPHNDAKQAVLSLHGDSLFSFCGVSPFGQGFWDDDQATSVWTTWGGSHFYSFLSREERQKTFLGVHDCYNDDHMAAVKKLKTQKEPPKTFRILYKGGQEDYVKACGFNYHPRQGDVIQFYDSNNVEAKDLLLRAPEVASVIADTRMVEAPPLLALQGRMSNLEDRMDSLEKSLVDIVMRAVNAAFEQRELKLSS